MKIATARTKTSKNWRTRDVSWEEFLDSLRTPMRTAETMREYKAMAKAERDRIKEAAGGFVGGALTDRQRKTEFVKERWMITLDADDAVPGQWERVTPLLDFRMCCYPTHSHTEESPRLRWVIPTDRPMTPDEYPAVSRMVASWIGIETIDPTTHDLARLFFYPSVPKDAPYDLKEQAGPMLSVDEVLATYGDNDAWRDTTLWPISKKESEVRVRNIQKAGDPLEKPGIVGLFCRTYDVEDVIAEFIPDVYTPCEHNGRYTYAGGSTFGGAIVYDDGRFLYSNHATDPCCGQSVNAFDLVRIHKFGELDADCGETPVTRRPSYREMVQLAMSLPEIRAQSMEEDMARMAADFEDLQSVASGETEDWRKLIVVDKDGRPEETIKNACNILRFHPDFRGKLGYNSMSDEITVQGDLPWWTNKTKPRLTDFLRGGPTEPGEAKRASVWGNGDWPNFYAYFEPLGFPTRGKTNGILDNALEIVTKENPHHPIQSYLQSLEWDGTERLDTMFIRWLGAEDCDLNREITRLWMIAGVDRVMRPGCQFDSVIILKGPQGVGKSRLLRALARGFFTDSMEKLALSKDVGEKLQGVWIAEIGELDGLRRSEVTATKQFITATSDRYRGAYTRKAEDHPRQCIFAGTTNEGSFLRDNTGERRFWILPVQGAGDQGELDGFKEEVDQLWAEAVELWRKRMLDCKTAKVDYEDVELKLYLRDQKLARAMALRQADYKLPEEDRDAVEGYLDELRPPNWYSLDPGIRRDFAQGIWLGDKEKCTLRLDQITVKELRCELFGERPEDAGTKSSRSLRLVSIMDNMPGWKKAGKKRVPGYGQSVVTTWSRVPCSEGGE